MTLPTSIADREFQKFIDVAPGDTAVRVIGSLTSGTMAPFVVSPVSISTPGVEQVLAVPAGVKLLSVHNAGRMILRVAYAPNGTDDGGNYTSIYPKMTKEWASLPSGGISLYFRAPEVTRIEVEAWG